MGLQLLQSQTIELLFLGRWGAVKPGVAGRAGGVRGAWRVCNCFKVKLLSYYVLEDWEQWSRWAGRAGGARRA